MREMALTLQFVRHEPNDDHRKHVPMSQQTPPWFNVRKAAQVAAYFALRAGGAVNVLKLVKLIYLADRLFIETFDAPMLNDELVSMDHGPVNSRTLNYINGTLIDPENWDAFVTARAGYDIGAADGVAIEMLDELSQADRQILDATWQRFGAYDKYRLRDYTHDHCPEWENPSGSSRPITYERLFNALAKDNVGELVAEVATQREISKAFAV